MLDADGERVLLSLIDAGDMAPPRVALVAAHPDDETVGAAGALPNWPDAYLVHITDGAPRDLLDARAHGYATRAAYAQARRKELEAALALLPFPLERCIRFDIADQEVSLQLVELSERLANLFREKQFAAVVTHPFEGGHPDHDATAFAVHSACALLRRAHEPAPLIFEMTCYHNSPDGIRVGHFLAGSANVVATQILDPEARARKRAMLACFATQQETLRQFPADLERFRLAPWYDFTRPPHWGRLFYEQFPWGMSGSRFRALALDALHRLKLDSPL